MKRVLPLLLLSPALAHAATLAVTSLADDGSAGTLRAQVAAAAAGDTIEFDASLAGGTIALATASGAIEIDADGERISVPAEFFQLEKALMLEGKSVETIQIGDVLVLIEQ